MSYINSHKQYSLDTRGDYHAKIFRDNGASVAYKQINRDMKYSMVDSKDFSANFYSIVLFDGVVLEFGDWSGRFNEMSLPTFSSPHICYGYMSSGNYNGKLDGRDFLLRENDIFACSPNHSMIVNDTPISCSCSQILVDIQIAKKEIGKILKNVCLEALYDNVIENPLIAQIPNTCSFNKMHEKQSSDSLRLYVLESLLLLYSSQKYKYFHNDNYIYLVEQYIKKNFNVQLSLKTLSEHFGVSVAKITRDFQNTYKMSYYQYQKNLRIQHAKKMLQEGMSVSECANNVGYVNVSAFCLNFRERVGISPKRYQLIELRKQKY